jgi:hypothetical protein
MKLYLDLTKDYVLRSEKMRDLNEHPVHANVHDSDFFAQVLIFTVLAATIAFLLLGE